VTQKKKFFVTQIGRAEISDFDDVLFSTFNFAKTWGEEVGENDREVSFLAGKTSRKNMISRRVAQLKDSIAVDTQKMRGKTLRKLENLFDLAVSLAKGEVKTQTEEGIENPGGSIMVRKA
jgi:hypothetical protein